MQLSSQEDDEKNDADYKNSSETNRSSKTKGGARGHDAAVLALLPLLWRHR